MNPLHHGQNPYKIQTAPGYYYKTDELLRCFNKITTLQTSFFSPIRTWTAVRDQESVNQESVTRSPPTTSYNTCRRPFYRSFGPKKKKDFCAATCCRPLCSIREKNIHRRCEDVFTIQASMQGDQLCVYPSTDDREGPACFRQENTFPGPDCDVLLYSLQTSPDSLWRAIQDVCSSGGNEAPDIINPTLLKDTVTEVVE
ncbi:uncharacterized protein TNCV_655971 [Trichonephila clavipes]|nr:uncharacterized protein TNCV_655971 [Trichonephila clavipes]